MFFFFKNATSNCDYTCLKTSFKRHFQYFSFNVVQKPSHCEDFFKFEPLYCFRTILLVRTILLFRSVDSGPWFVHITRPSYAPLLIHLIVCKESKTLPRRETRKNLFNFSNRIFFQRELEMAKIAKPVKKSLHQKVSVIKSFIQFWNKVIYRSWSFC